MPGDHFLQIGGITIALRGTDPRVRWQWNRAAERFLVPPREADVELEVRVLEAPLPVAGELLFDSGAVWRMYREARQPERLSYVSERTTASQAVDAYRIECTSEAFGDGPYKVAVFDSTFTRGTIFIRPEVVALELSPLDYPLDEVLIANLLGRGRGVELHSCGIIDKAGRGHLFVGVSGAGKSTTAGLWEGASAGVVSDDRVIVREHDGAMWMYGTPWHGEADLSMAARAPLAGVYLLEQASANELRALPRATAMARLFRCAFPPFYDHAAVEFTLAMLERLAEAVPVRELRFTRDPSVVGLVLGDAA